VRISPATAKFKPQQLFEMAGMQAPPQGAFDSSTHSALAAPFSAPDKPASHAPSMTPSVSVSSTIAAPPSFSAAPAAQSNTAVSSMSAVEEAGIPAAVLAQIAQIAASANSPPAAPSLSTLGSVSAPFSDRPQLQPQPQPQPQLQPQPQPQSQSQSHEPPRFSMSDESWKHQVQARAILSNLIGPHGEQLTSSDPYNTTVFVGGLSPLISEETLRTFFAPFGDIHYVSAVTARYGSKTI
jgi:hypothetical protein